MNASRQRKRPLCIFCRKPIALGKGYTAPGDKEPFGHKTCRDAEPPYWDQEAAERRYRRRKEFERRHPELS